MAHKPSISPSSPVIAGIAAGAKSARSRSAIQSTTPASRARRVRNQFEVDPGGRPARSSTRAWLNARTPSAPSSSTAASSARSRVAAGMDTPFHEVYYEYSTPPHEGVVMATPEPRVTRSVDASAWSPPLPEASGFDHLVVETPGLRTHVAAIGEGEPVVLLHGFPQHWWQWHAIAPVIAAGGYRVICPDLRGAGWTVANDPRIERETRLRDLLALFDVLHIERAHLVAHDMGAITAMQLAYEHPERV